MECKEKLVYLVGGKPKCLSVFKNIDKQIPYIFDFLF